MTTTPVPQVVVSWTASAEEVRNAPAIVADPPPVSDGEWFVPAAITARYTAVGAPRQRAASWSCAEVVLHRRDGDQVTTRTFTQLLKGMPRWAEEFVMENHPYARRLR